MKFIEKIKLLNFKRFDVFEYAARQNRNIFVGDNEAGKSTILQAVDITLSGSRSRVESLGLESLFNNDVIAHFLAGDKSLDDLPVLNIEVYLNDHGNINLEGFNNSDERECHGIRLICEALDDYGGHIQAALAEDDALFPFEYYSINFLTFAGYPYAQNHRFLNHILIDSSLIGTEFATRRYTKSLYEAHAGKTTHIIDSLGLDERSIIITYTDNNYHLLRGRIIHKFGVIPENITVLTYFTFLYSFCYKPFLHDRCRAKGINWHTPPGFTLRLNRTDRRFYFDDFDRIYNNRIAKLVEREQVEPLIMARLSKYFDQLFIDEVQDFGGHDFNLLTTLCGAALNITLVGDFYQHTFDTSRDGVLNQSLYKDYKVYKSRFQEAGLTIDTETLSHSYRCTPEVCKFITKQLGISIQSHKETSSNVQLITEEDEIFEIFACDDTAKLFFREHKRYPCYSENWGKSKGQDHYIDVCVMLYPVAKKAFDAGNLRNLPPSSRNKLYVACTRANNNLFFVEEKRVKHLKS